jgi:UDP-GlcNAc:undecaprenyl-phosphate/decaprenyl-phosphate GlcNAc-1-phosphate transferase
MSVSVIGLVNAANMADGQNGLLTGLFLIWAMCLSLVSSGDSHCSLILLGAAAIVFLFNLPGRLFLGDCGSYGVTFMVAILSIRAHASGAATVAMIIAWFFVPVADCLRLMITRRLSGRSPLSADRDHLHHRLQEHFGTNAALGIYLGTVATTAIFAAALPPAAPLCVAALVIFYGWAIWRTTDRSSQEQIVFRFDRSPGPAPSGSVIMLPNATPDGDKRPEFADGAFGVSSQDAAPLPFAERKSARHAG